MRRRKQGTLRSGRPEKAAGSRAESRPLPLGSPKPGKRAQRSRESVRVDRWGRGWADYAASDLVIGPLCRTRQGSKAALRHAAFTFIALATRRLRTGGSRQ